MKLPITLLLCLVSLRPLVEAQFHPIGSSKPLPDYVVPNIITAVEDEIYDYKQEQSFTNIGSTGAIGVPTKVALFIEKSISDRNIGWILYKDMPHGEVLRRFIINDSGLVVLYGDPEIDFPAQQPDTQTLYLDDDDVCRFKAQALKTTFTVDPNVPKTRVEKAEQRQIQRVHYSFRIDHVRKKKQ